MSTYRELGGEAALSNAGLTTDHHELTSTLGGSLEVGLQPG
jgi:hypothetical protein